MHAGAGAPLRAAPRAAHSRPAFGLRWSTWPAHDTLGGSPGVHCGQHFLKPVLVQFVQFGPGHRSRHGFDPDPHQAGRAHRHLRALHRGGEHPHPRGGGRGGRGQAAAGPGPAGRAHHPAHEGRHDLRGGCRREDARGVHPEGAAQPRHRPHPHRGQRAPPGPPGGPPGREAGLLRRQGRRGVPGGPDHGGRHRGGPRHQREARLHDRGHRRRHDGRGGHQL